MAMSKMPEVIRKGNGRFWKAEYDTFRVKVYVPDNDLRGDVINYGFGAPYLIVLEEKEQSPDEAIAWAEQSGLAKIAASYDSSVVFVYPTAEGGWSGADVSLYQELIANSKIHQYFKDGCVTMRNRFTGEWAGFFIRGAIFRTYVYGFGASADYIGKYLLQTVNGEFLWGPGEITPACCILNGAKAVPDVKRSDIPVISIGNGADVNMALSRGCKKVLVKAQADYTDDFKSFLIKYRRWCGNTENEPNLEELGMIREDCVEVLPTSKDNMGDDKGTTEHEVGYLAYYNKGLLDNGPVPMLIAFHGGGDSAMYISNVSGWYSVAHKHNFLLIAIENHLNSTATEMVALIEKLKKKYPVDASRIYASGFSMGGCKSWDLYQEYPGVFAGLAPMDATFEVGDNSYGQKAPCEINKNVPVPVFYAGGEITPLPELPFQAHKCWDRIRYLFEVNRVKNPYAVTFENQEAWENKIWGVNGDRTDHFDDPSRGSVLTVEYFDSTDGVCRTALGSISGQGHECRVHTCEHAWLFLSKYTR